MFDRILDQFFHSFLLCRRASYFRQSEGVSEEKGDQGAEFKAPFPSNRGQFQPESASETDLSITSNEEVYTERGVSM